MKWMSVVICLALASVTIALGHQRSERVLEVELLLDAPVREVWEAWTTESGVESFFAPACKIELRVDGVYGIYFDPSAEAGKRGADGMRILQLEPMKRFSFTWNAPLDQPYVRAQRTVVTIALEATSPQKTELHLVHRGWGEGPEWDRAYDYFDKGWGAMVLPRLVYRFEMGPIDWKNPPKVEPVKSTLKTRYVGAGPDSEESAADSAVRFVSRMLRHLSLLRWAWASGPA